MIALDKYNIEDCIFIDIEVVRGKKTYDKKDKNLVLNWEYTMHNEVDPDYAKLYLDKSSFYAEFSKVCCISVGAEVDGKLATFSFSGEDEAELLKKFSSWSLKKCKQNPRLAIVGHSIKSFDLPFLMKRLIVNGIELPPFIDTAHLKPWEATFTVDISELWKAGSKTPSSLTSICYALGLESPKEAMDGSMVSDEYYKGNLKGIVEYCEKNDVPATYNVFKKLKNS